MKLYHCSKCGRYSREVSAAVLIRTRIRLYLDDEVKVVGEDLYDEEVIDTCNLICLGCDTMNVEKIYLEVCPHSWQTIQNAWNNFRRCELCGEEQQGKVVFDD